MRYEGRKGHTYVPPPPEVLFEVLVIDGRPVEPIPGPMDVLREVPGGSLDVRAVADHVRNDPTTLHVALEVRLSQLLSGM